MSHGARHWHRGHDHSACAARRRAVIRCAAPELRPVLVAAEAVIADGQREHSLPGAVRGLAVVCIRDAVEGVDRQPRLRGATGVEYPHQ